MQDRNNRKDDKLQSDGEIRVPSLRNKKPEREHGRLYKWFDNFWYHHKWKTLLSLFLILTILVCTLQMCEKEEKGDISVMMAGPYSFVDNAAALTSLRQCLARYMPADYDENGVKQVDAVTYMIYSQQQLDDMAKERDENGQLVYGNMGTIKQTNVQNYSQYNTYMMLGETSVLFLDPWLFEEMAKKENDYLADLSVTYGKAPEEGAVEYTDRSGNTRIVGVRLGDTALYRDNLAVSQVLPEDTVLCLMSPYVIGKSSSEEEYQKAVDLFAALAGMN